MAGAIRILMKERQLQIPRSVVSLPIAATVVRADPVSDGICVPPLTRTLSCPRQLDSPFSVDDDLDSRAPPLLLTSSFAKQFGSSSYVDDDLQDVVNIPPSAHTPPCLTQLDSSFDADDDMQNVDNLLTPVQCPQLQFKEGTVGIPENRFDQGLKDSDSLGTVPGRNATLSEVVEVVKLESPLPVESASPIFVTAPVVEEAPDMVEYFQFASVAEHFAPVQTETADFATPTPVFESVQVLQVQAVEKIIEVPHMQIIEEIVEIPELQTVQAVDETTYESATGDHTPNLVPIPSYLREFGASFYADDDLRDVENNPPSAHTPSCLTQLGSSFDADGDVQHVDNILTPVQWFDISDSKPQVCSQNSAGEMDCENLTASNRDETAIVRHVSFAENVEAVEFNPAVHVTLSPVVEYDAALIEEYDACAEHDLELGCYDLEEISYMVCMNRKRTWKRAWHSSPNPLDASKSERSWRRLSGRLCYEECFDEMKRTCAHCGMFEDDDDILVQCQGPECSLRPYGIPGVFHGRCAKALGFSGGARWQNCPWCPPAAITAPIAECLSPVLAASCAASASWTTPLINDAVENENGLNPDDIKFVMLQVNCSRSKAVSALRDSNSDLIEAVTQCLSTAMLDELVEDFDKPGGIGAMIDKSFERFDQPNKKLESDEGVANENDLEPRDIELVMSHANCSRFKAVSALRANSNNVMNAIIMLCLEKEDTVMQAENSDIIGTDGKRSALRKKRQRRRQRTATLSRQMGVDFLRH